MMVTLAANGSNWDLWVNELEAVAKIHGCFDVLTYAIPKACKSPPKYGRGDPMGDRIPEKLPEALSRRTNDEKKRPERGIAL
jgi:hypothetical protein